MGAETVVLTVMFISVYRKKFTKLWGIVYGVLSCRLKRHFATKCKKSRMTRSSNGTGELETALSGGRVDQSSSWSAPGDEVSGGTDWFSKG